jgi:hypothetical protein
MNSDPQTLAKEVEAWPLSFERLRDLLVECRIIHEEAATDPDGYDECVTMGRIERLHRKLTDAALTEFVDRIRAQERERCAVICEGVAREYDHYSARDPWPDPESVTEKCAAAIRNGKDGG